MHSLNLSHFARLLTNCWLSSSSYLSSFISRFSHSLLLSVFPIFNLSHCFFLHFFISLLYFPLFLSELNIRNQQYLQQQQSYPKVGVCFMAEQQWFIAINRSNKSNQKHIIINIFLKWLTIESNQIMKKTNKLTN